MNTMSRRVTIAGAVAAAAFAMVPAAAQDTTTTTTTTTAAKQVKRVATPQMIDEAIQRSQARTNKLNTLGRPEQWGSEEPFTYTPR